LGRAGDRHGLQKVSAIHVFSFVAMSTAVASAFQSTKADYHTGRSASCVLRVKILGNAFDASP